MTQEIRAILCEIRPEFEFDEKVDFIEEGMLDSFDVITLVAKLEEMYEINIDVMEIMPENFSSVESIVNMITAVREKC